jgi:hypothetical protein
MRKKRASHVGIDKVARAMVTAGIKSLNADKKLCKQLRANKLGEEILKLADSPIDAAAALLTFLEGVA